MIHRVATSVGDNLWDRSVYWGKSGIFLLSRKLGASNLVDIVKASLSAGYIWSGLRSGETNYGARAGAAVAGRKN